MTGKKNEQRINAGSNNDLLFLTQPNYCLRHYYTFDMIRQSVAAIAYCSCHLI